MRCEEGEKERRKLTQLTMVAEAAAVVSVRLRQSAWNRGGQDVARQNKTREICVEKENTGERSRGRDFSGAGSGFVELIIRKRC